MTSQTKYYLCLERIDGVWDVVFGSYFKAECIKECLELRDKGVSRFDRQVVTCPTAYLSDITALVADLNRK